MRPPQPTARPSAIPLLLDIGQGAGLAGASGIRPFLPPLLAGALARGDVGIDFEGGSFSFLESPWFLLALLVAAGAAYAIERARAAASAEGSEGREAARDLERVDGALGALGVVIGALLFAGSLTEGGRSGWPGLPAGAACAALGYVAVAGFFARARRRAEPGAAGLLGAYAEALALALAAAAVFAPPVAFLALAAFLVVLARARASGKRKYEGLRVLR